MTLKKEEEKTMRYINWRMKIPKTDIQGVISSIVKDIFERYKGIVIEIREFEKDLSRSIEEDTKMKCIYHIDVSRHFNIFGEEEIKGSAINEKIKIIYENNTIDTIVCGNKNPNDPTFYAEAKYIIDIKLERILIETEGKLYMMPLEVKYIRAREV